MDISVALVVLAIHVIGASIWVGSSLLLGLVALGVRDELGGDRVLYSKIMSRVARTAGTFMWGALVVTLLTGLYNLSWFLPEPTVAAIESTPWLLAKLVLVVLMVALAGVHSFVLGPMTSRRRRAGAGRDSGWLQMASHLTSLASALLGIAILFVAVMLAGGA